MRLYVFNDLSASYKFIQKFCHVQRKIIVKNKYLTALRGILFFYLISPAQIRQATGRLSPTGTSGGAVIANELANEAQISRIGPPREGGDLDARRTGRRPERHG